jgi:hypothetical protein
MKKLLLITAAFAFIGATSARADVDINITPEIDAWVMTQPDTSVNYDGDIIVGTELPGTVTFIDTPDRPDVAYVVVNKKRVLVNKKTRKVIKVYK